MYCTKCGTKLGKDDVFCSACGTKKHAATVANSSENEEQTQIITEVNETRQVHDIHQAIPNHDTIHKTEKENKIWVFLSILLSVLIIVSAAFFYKLITAPKNRNLASLLETDPVTDDDEGPESDKYSPKPESTPEPAPAQEPSGTPPTATPDPIDSLDEALIKAKNFFTDYTSWDAGKWGVGENGERCAVFTAALAGSQEYHIIYITADGTDSYARYGGELQEYIIPDSDRYYLTMSDIRHLSKEELRLARNEIYAKHGRMFDSQDLQDYFNAKSWYTPRIPAADFNDNLLNEIEKYNTLFIKDYEDMIN